MGKESHMIKKNLPLVALALLTAGFFLLQAEQKVKPTAGRKPPAILIKCPDIAVTGMQITLVNTLLGDPQVEFPMDTVKLEATLENVGSEPVPPGALLYVILKKNGEAIQSAVGTDNLGAPGSRWTYSVNDSFRHGQKTTYVIQAASTLRECRVSNNQMTRTIDEKKLHPAGNPDLTTSIFAVEKRWKREGTRFQAYFDLAADVANSGSGFSNSASRLLFVLNDDQVVLATLNIPQDDLPGPGQKKRFSTELTAVQVPLGESLVNAYIEQARNEFVGNNNWSPNSGQISNSAGPPASALAILDFLSWHLIKNQLSATIQLTNLQNQYLRNVRLIMFKDNVPVKEWPTLACGPRGLSHVRYVEERQPPTTIFGRNHYRAVLTSDLDKTPPPEGTVLDSQARDLYWVKFGAGLLQNNMQDKNNGLAAQVQRQNKNFLVKETQAGIGPSGILISVKGKKIINNSSAVEFQVDFLLNPRVILGQVKLDVAKTVVHLGPGLSEFYSTMLAPMLCQSIKTLIEKFAEKKLAANLSKVPDSLGKLANPFGAPAGIVMAAGALDIYY